MELSRESDSETPAYRQSLIATFDSCPLRAKFGREDVRRSPSPLAARGTLLHRAMHQAVREMQREGERRFSVEQGMELLTAVLSQMGPNVESGDVVPLSMREMRWCRVIMTKWCEYVDLDPAKIIGIERRLTAPLELLNGKTVNITGQLDLLLADPPDGVIVIDYKTGFRSPKTPRTGGDPGKIEMAEAEGTGLTELGWVQFLVYSYLCYNQLDWIQRVIFREVHVLRQEERQGRMDAFQMERLTDPLRAQVTLLHQAVEEGPDSPRWVPTAGQHCGFCSKPSACPIMNEAEIDIDTEEGRRAVASQWIVAGARRKEREEYLKGIADAYGPIEVVRQDGQRVVVGWDLEHKRFGMYEPFEADPSPWDEELERAGRKSGVIQDD